MLDTVDGLSRPTTGNLNPSWTTSFREQRHENILILKIWLGNKAFINKSLSIIA